MLVTVGKKGKPTSAKRRFGGTTHSSRSVLRYQCFANQHRMVEALSTINMSTMLSERRFGNPRARRHIVSDLEAEFATLRADVPSWNRSIVEGITCIVGLSEYDEEITSQKALSDRRILQRALERFAEDVFGDRQIVIAIHRRRSEDVPKNRDVHILASYYDVNLEPFRRYWRRKFGEHRFLTCATEIMGRIAERYGFEVVEYRRSMQGARIQAVDEVEWEDEYGEAFGFDMGYRGEWRGR